VTDCPWGYVHINGEPCVMCELRRAKGDLATMREKAQALARWVNDYRHRDVVESDAFSQVARMMDKLGIP